MTTLAEQIRAMPVAKNLEWKPFWKQDEGRREAALGFGWKSYHISDKGWWHLLETLHPCDGIEAARSSAQADYEARLTAATNDLRGMLADAIEAMDNALEWDKYRKFIMPYSVRDPIHATLARIAAQIGGAK